MFGTGKKMWGGREERIGLDRIEKDSAHMVSLVGR